MARGKRYQPAQVVNLPRQIEVAIAIVNPPCARLDMSKVDWIGAECAAFASANTGGSGALCHITRDQDLFVPCDLPFQRFVGRSKRPREDVIRRIELYSFYRVFADVVARPYSGDLVLIKYRRF